MEIASKNIASDGVALNVVFEDTSCRVISGTETKKVFLGLGKKVLTQIVVVDRNGLAKLTLKDADIIITERSDFIDVLRSTIDKYTTFGDGGAIVRTTFMVYSGKVIELSKVGDKEKMLKFAEMELTEHPGYEKYCIILRK